MLIYYSVVVDYISYIPCNLSENPVNHGKTLSFKICPAVVIIISLEQSSDLITLSLGAMRYMIMLSGYKIIASGKLLIISYLVLNSQTLLSPI